MKYTFNLYKFFKKKANNLVYSCIAPQNSLRFNHSGNVLACCFNRGNILGRFPEQSINEIWFGENISKLRNSLNHCDYSLGCQGCEFSIKNNNREASGAAQYDYLMNYEQYKHFPTMMDFELGSTCNFECIMCSGEYSSTIRKNREGKPVYYSPYEEYQEEFISQLIPFIPHLKEMRFTGGEPFLMEIYYKIWEKLIDINPKILISIISNGSILNNKVKKIVERGNFKISLSIDSLNKTTYEAIRINGKFENIIENAQYFQEICTKNGHVMNYNICVMRQNYKEIPEYFEYCNLRDIKVILHHVTFPAHCSIWNLSALELKEIVILYENVHLPNKEKVSGIKRHNMNTFLSLKKHINTLYQEALKREEIHYLNDKVKLIYEIEKRIQANTDYLNYKKNFNYMATIEKLINNFDESDQLIILNYIFNMEIKILIDEFNISTEERILERLKLLINQ